MKTIRFFTNIAPHYRKPLWMRLLKSNEIDINFYFGDPGKTGIKEIDFDSLDILEFNNRLIRIKNFWILNKIVFWQSGVIKNCLLKKMDVSIFTAEMNCISTWIAAIICRMRNIEVVFWGHGIYGNESKVKLFFRKLFYRLADKHLLYERRGKSLMLQNGFNPDKLYVIFNSLDYDLHLKLREKFELLNKADVFPFFGNPELPVLIFIGRLTPQKRVELVIEAVKLINADQVLFNLLIIGDGSERENLTERSKKGINNNWIHFTGGLYDENLICKYLYCSDLCVSPGNVGLTAIHSLSMGTPVATHNNFFNQMPEVESIIEGFNGFLFPENSIAIMRNKILDWVRMVKQRELIRLNCYKVVDEKYNPKNQLIIIQRILNSEKPTL
ncbi:glycosyltransferase [uncultured Cyclobacterium sp.]|uniref:glycosyltransferase family 4 protein n=1 Tax=uncultured Cyclobacterium sp. TaxID=453820 RepID=UPI0030EE057A|tara:strand:- start:3285 stop:4439 length:1155 start_codon:yes stop_codon:yes gene_type:complete